MLDFSWSESVEVRGKVRLEAFEKYVQDLPRSRSRGLMVRRVTYHCSHMSLLVSCRTYLPILDCRYSIPVFVMSLSENMLFAYVSCQIHTIIHI